MMMYSAAYAVLLIVLETLGLCPVRGSRDLAFRWELANAIVGATDDPHEREVLVRIAWLESAFRADVARCSVRGDRGRSLGTFQIQPITPHDRQSACGDLDSQAKLAVAYVRRSAEACPGNVGADRLAMYVSGTCTRGLAQSKNRWGRQ